MRVIVITIFELPLCVIGEYGKVFRGEWKYINNAGAKVCEEVAVKTLKSNYMHAV